MILVSQKIVSAAAILSALVSGYGAKLVTDPPAVDATPTTITAVWTCDSPRPLANDATQTVRDCHWVTR